MSKTESTIALRPRNMEREPDEDAEAGAMPETTDWFSGAVPGHTSPWTEKGKIGMK